MMPPMIVGIIGGLGPAATCAFYRRIIDKTPARRDQDHLHVVIDSNPATPDRTAALLAGGESPLPWLLRSADRLTGAGAELLAMPCATAHAWIDDLRAGASAEVVSMIDATGDRLASMDGIERVGLLATDGTVRADVFAPLRRRWELLTPTDDEQRQVMTAIYGPDGVKAAGATAEANALLVRAAWGLIDRGAQVVVAGCTEIPLALTDGDVPVPVLDTLEILAEGVVRRASAP